MAMDVSADAHVGEAESRLRLESNVDSPQSVSLSGTGFDLDRSSFALDSADFDVVFAIPEPGTAVLVGFGLLRLGLRGGGRRLG